MPQHLDLGSYTSTHGDMLLSPRLNLRRASSYTNLEKGPQSSTSSRFSFNQLITSPPPSPGLPAIVPRHGKTVSSKPSPRRCARLALWLSGIIAILYYAVTFIRLSKSTPSVGWSNTAGSEYDMVGQDALPDFPTPVVITDKRGRSKWTVSIPPSYDFPLKPQEYAEICMATMDVSNHVNDLHRHTHIDHKAHYSYYRVDPNFMDVKEAEEVGMLPGAAGMLGTSSSKLVGKDGSLLGESNDELVVGETCKTSMTYVLESSDAGLGTMLMSLWIAYGLSQKEGRAFFIDDSRWAYGSYLSYFQPPPVPTCRPPPRHEMLPCPHHARHLLVSHATLPWTLGPSFTEAFEDARKMEVARQRPIFELARLGYKTLFNLTDADNVYAAERIDALSSKIATSDPDNSGLMVAIHVRHGDRHPLDFKYRDSYIPLDTYVSTAHDLIADTFNSSSFTSEEEYAAQQAAQHSLIVVASDDPDVYDSYEFSTAARAQDLIHLASKKTLGTDGKKGKPTFPGSLIRGFVDETVGWEGGFFAGMFWTLGRKEVVVGSTPSGSGNGDAAEGSEVVKPSEEMMRLRELVGRAYLLDLKILGQADRVVCTVGAVGCRLLAVMLGWDAMVDGNWKNVDGDFDWRGIGY